MISEHDQFRHLINQITERNYQCIYFDLDGTLLDDKERHFRCYCDIVKKYGGNCIYIEEYWNDKRNKISREILLRKTGFQGSYEEYLKEWIERIEKKEYLLYETLKPYAESVLKTVRQYVNKLVLVTMRRNKENLLWQLNELELKSMFDEIFIGDPIISQKKDLLSSGNGIFEGKKLIVGDTEADEQLALSISGDFLAVTSGLRDKKYLNGDYYMEDYVDLSNLLYTYAVKI